MSTFVLVHGGWGGGWEWRGVADRLRAAGHEAYRPTRTGLGERRHLLSPSVTLETHVDDVSNLLWFEDLRDVVLCGHSYGGIVATCVADRAPERLAHVVYIDAFVPHHGSRSSTRSRAPGRRRSTKALAADAFPSRSRGRRAKRGSEAGTRTASPTIRSRR